VEERHKPVGLVKEERVGTKESRESVEVRGNYLEKRIIKMEPGKGHWFQGSGRCPVPMHMGKE